MRCRLVCLQPYNPGMSACGQRSLLRAALLLLLTFAAYVPVVRAGYVWDDDDLLTRNLNIRSASGLWTTWFDPANGGRFYPDYYPLTYTTWALEYRLWGLHPLGYHLNNVLLHGLNAVLVWVILRRLRVPGAYLAAGIFALHPVHVESVAWVSERKNVLSGLFYLLTAWSFLATFDPQPGGDPTIPAATRFIPRRIATFILSLLLFALAMLSKPVSMTLAGALPLLLWWRRGRLTWREIAPAIPYLLLALPMALLTTWFQHHHVRLAGKELSFSFLERTLIAGRVLAFYAGKLLWPASLSFAYPSWKIDAAAAWQWLFPAGVAGLLGLLWLARRRIGVGPLVAVLFFCINLSPALGYIDILWHRYYFVADHVQYLASLGLTALVAALAVRLVRPEAAVARDGAALLAGPHDDGARPGPDVIAVASARIAAGALLALLGMLTFAQATTYHSKQMLWSDVLEKQPDSWVAMINLGTELAQAGEIGRAREHFERALQINPAAYEAHYNLGTILEREDRHEEAMRHFETAVSLKPHFPAALNAIAKALAARGELGEAETKFRLALDYNPHLSDAHYNLGLLLARTRRRSEALREFDLALRYDPTKAEAHVAAAVELQAAGDVDGAIARYRQALAIRPDYVQALNNLAVLLVQRRYVEEPIELYRRAIKAKPDYVLSRTNLAVLLETIGKPDEAIFHLREAARLKPDDAAVAEALRTAMARRLGSPATAP